MHLTIKTNNGCIIKSERYQIIKILKYRRYGSVYMVFIHNLCSHNLIIHFLLSSPNLISSEQKIKIATVNLNFF